MLLTSLRVEGLRAAPVAELDDPGLVVRLPPGPPGAALADGLALLAAALRPGVTSGTLAALDLATPDTGFLLDGPIVDEVEHLDADGVAALVAPGTARTVTIRVTARLDPPMFRRLRDVAARDPRLVTALGSGGGLDVRVGWLFNHAGTHASVGLLGFAVGDERFPTTGTERPPWLLDVLADVGARLLRVDRTRDEEGLAHALHHAALSPDPARRAAFGRAREVLAAPPFATGPLHLVQTRPGRLRLGLGDDVLPLRLFGPGALEAVRVVHAAVVEHPDVLVVDAGPPGLEAWLHGLVEGDDATIEQALIVGAPAS